MEGIKLPRARPMSVHARHVYTVWCEGCARDDLIAHLHGEGIGAVVNYRPIHLMSYFVERYGYRRGDSPSRNGSGSARFRCRSIRICRSMMSMWWLRRLNASFANSTNDSECPPARRA